MTSQLLKLLKFLISAIPSETDKFSTYTLEEYEGVSLRKLNLRV